VVTSPNLLINFGVSVTSLKVVKL